MAWPHPLRRRGGENFRLHWYCTTPKAESQNRLSFLYKPPEQTSLELHWDRQEQHASTGLCLAPSHHLAKHLQLNLLNDLWSACNLLHRVTPRPSICCFQGAEMSSHLVLLLFIYLLIRCIYLRWCQLWTSQALTFCGLQSYLSHNVCKWLHVIKKRS